MRERYFTACEIPLPWNGQIFHSLTISGYSELSVASIVFKLSGSVLYGQVLTDCLTDIIKPLREYCTYFVATPKLLKRGTNDHE